MDHRFVKQSIKEGAGQKLHIIAENLGVPHSKVIKRWACRYGYLIEQL